MTSYSKAGTNDLNILLASLQQDIDLSLMQINFKEDVKLGTSFKIDLNYILIGTKKITQYDLKTDTVLQLNVSLTIGDSTTKIKPKSWNLNVTTKTDQQIIDYINSINFTKIKNFAVIAKDSTIDNFKKLVTQIMAFTAGSFGFSFINSADILRLIKF